MGAENQNGREKIPGGVWVCWASIAAGIVLGVAAVRTGNFGKDAAEAAKHAHAAIVEKAYSSPSRSDCIPAVPQREPGN